MRLKYNFVLREVAGKQVAVAVGKDNAKFHGMVKLNEQGAFIFRMLREENRSEEELTAAAAEKYGVSEESARPLIREFLQTLRQGELLEE